ncbi:hypothetical protein [Shewanella khirikhana]|uniref:EAL domain protein n=1 Tax=Shewanella khirikhana TaxID=1965282 RepID=A0ABM7DPE0_9GAMM|nr:hypothetical protein [Shewanella khirikhana]AZQ11536.1 EAL domain protein [Shewanella khirikhana]
MDTIIKSCKYLNSPLSSDIIFINKNIKDKGEICYKLQEVHDSKGKIVGYEILTDSVLTSGIRFFSCDDVLELIYIKAVHTSELKFMLGKTLYVNIENYELCNFHILKKIVELNLVLDACGIKLVIELTERDHCFPCKNFGLGLKYLYENRISLAADDYNMFKSDYRNKFLNYHFDFVKLEVPSLSSGFLDDFIESSKLMSSCFKFVVFERIEKKEQLDLILELRLSNALFQGFYFRSAFVKLSRK